MRAVVVQIPQLHQSLAGLDDKPTEQRNCELGVPGTRPCTVTTLFGGSLKKLVHWVCSPALPNGCSAL